MQSFFFRKIIPCHIFLWLNKFASKFHWKMSQNMKTAFNSTHTLPSFTQLTASVTFNYQSISSTSKQICWKNFPSWKDVWEVAIFSLRLLLIETVFKSLTAPTFKEIARQVSSRLGVEGSESFAKTEKEICFLFLQRLTEAMLFCVKVLFPLPLQFAKVPFVRLYVSFLHRDAKI